MITLRSGPASDTAPRTDEQSSSTTDNKTYLTSRGKTHTECETNPMPTST
ncbi:hypothetical protein [Streptomyces xanthophaeus]